MGCLKFLDSYRLLDDNLNKIPATLTSFPSLDANGIGNGLVKGKRAYLYEKGQSIKSVYEPLELGREDYLPTLKQSYAIFEEIMRTQVEIVKIEEPF